MKVCEVCYEEIGTRDGDNRCARCHQSASEFRRPAEEKKRRKRSKSAMQLAAEACGLKRVRGAMGGVYYE